MEYIIEVTQADIDKANAARREYVNYTQTKERPYNGYQTTSHCPIAQALRCKFPLADDFCAHPDGLKVDLAANPWSALWRADTTEKMRMFMRRWDRTWQAKPHRFRVRSR